MPTERTYYVICEDNCKFESMTKEQILSAITEAVESRTISDVDTGFVTTIKEQNGNTGIKTWVGTQAQYNALIAGGEVDNTTFYIITDDDTFSEITELANSLSENVDIMRSKIESVGETICTSLSINEAATCESINNYKYFAVFLGTHQTPIICSRITVTELGAANDYIAGAGIINYDEGITSAGAPSLVKGFVSVLINGTTLTNINSGAYGVDGTTWGTQSVTKIVGIV